MDLNEINNQKQIYYDLRLDSMLLLNDEEISLVKQLYKTADNDNIIIAIELMKSKIKKK